MTDDARMIGRRGRGLAVVLALAGVVGWAAGCEGLRGDEEPPSDEQAETKAPEAKAPEAKAPAPPSLLGGVVSQAIAPPPQGGTTYRVDAYLGALIVEHLRRDPLPFIAWRSESDDPSQPSEGYRVGPLQDDDVWTKLGLREGDIVTELNGVSSTDESWVAQALERGENRVTVSVFRDGMSIVLSYRLMGGMAWNEVRAEFGPAAEVALAETPDEGGEELSDEVERGFGVPGAGAGAPGGGGASPGGGGASPGGGGTKTPTSRPTPSRPTPSRPSSGSGGSGGSGGSAAVAQCSSATRCTLKKSYFDSIVRSPSKLESQANIVPAIRNDVFSGYKLKSVRSGSAVSQLGFRSGDKITHINGRDLTNDVEAMQLYMGLSSTRRFQIRYVRGGSTRTKTIDVV